ncbi:hypothetical protein [Rhizohabitans arisaemae]|uniref:hypothetical protein n=1 Tax=Rhizohabitans arisaemae TaxID=2720610 RepID=UPI0024B196B9|nr:hypothetical protein [Rhizohabitans arisaemae]
MKIGTLVWFVALLVAGSAGVALCLATAETLPGAAPDLFDSSYLAPVFGVLAVLAAVASWFRPGASAVWGLAVAVPFFAVLAFRVVVDGSGDGLWVVGLGILILLTVLPVSAALLTAVFARRAP